MPKAKSNTNYPEISDIREDLDSLKHNVIELTKHLGTDGQSKTQAVKKEATAKLFGLRNKGIKQLVKTRKRITEKPGQSLAIAFAAGAVISFLASRK
jgi:ElaB/YqjD/DUF883 family membrane-anchored ribosome-binding protein